MLMTGQLEIHKSDNKTRTCEAVIRLEDGGLAVYDVLPDAGWVYQDGTIYREKEQPDDPGVVNTSRLGRPIEPHIIVQSDQYDRVERKDSFWKSHSPKALRQKAEERDDVDEDELPDNI